MSVTRSILVTGANRGFGQALTRAYMDAGARVFALMRSGRCADGFSDADSARLVPMVGDVRDNSVMEIIRRTITAHGGELDMLVNNAGTPGQGLRLDTLDADHLLRQFDVHCAGAARCTRAALPFLERAGRGVVVNLSSRLGSLRKNAAGDFSPGAFSYDYRIAKAAQNMLSLCLNQELSSRGIAVCALHPGKLITDSGSADADIDVHTAAARFVELFSEANRDAGGKFLDLFGGELPW